MDGEAATGVLSDQALSPTFKISSSGRFDSTGEALSKLTRLRFSDLRVTG
jgi:hypothetical protein